jgi:hypothetical protein
MTAGGGRADARLSSPSYICCGRRLKRIDITTASSQMAFTYCSGCSAMRWFRDDEPVELANVTAEATATWGRTASTAAH